LRRLVPARPRCEYRELGPDYYARRKPEQMLKRAIRTIESLGYTATLTTAA
jgi:hypothetical protein